MCGICGKLRFDQQGGVDPALIDKMMGAISHRGPDGIGKFIQGPVGLGHARLAIIDLSTGDQPMSNEDQTVWVVYNGEIYNYPALRKELIQKGHKFRSTTDTEVIVHLYEEYGTQCLSRLRGMFAFALWDTKEQTLLLARDRVGIKPLYYAETPEGLVFGSEIKSLLADPQVTCRVNPQSVNKFLTHLCLPGKDTLWQGIQKLEPGYYLVAKQKRIEIKQYWDLKFGEGRAWSNIDEACDALYSLIKRTVTDHMISDVPVGFLLSGGVDSTVVLSCAASETSKVARTFTVGFENAHFEDERAYARIAAKQFGTEHHEITVTPEEFWDFLPSLVWHMEEPVCDPPAVSLHYVSKLARQHVKVLLSGEGGDEAFGGYPIYRNLSFLERAKTICRPLNGALTTALRAAGHCAPFKKVGKYSPFASVALERYYYSRVASPFSFFNLNKPDLYTPDFHRAVSEEQSVEVIRDLFRQVKDQPPLNQMQYIDTKTSLPEDLLIKADRITMGNSLELRVPFLDHEVLEFASHLPLSFRVKGLQTKRILKRAFKGKIPDQIIKRKKAGFPIPIETWIQQDLRDRVRDILLSKQALERGFFNRKGIERLLSLSDSGQNVAKEVFSLLTLELLQRKFVVN